MTNNHTNIVMPQTIPRPDPIPLNHVKESKIVFAFIIVFFNYIYMCISL